jgi:predicted GIY-YIG superfamily endonuclease
MHWIYVLIEKDYPDYQYYVGETRRLGARFREHDMGKEIIRLFALYKLQNDVLWKHGIEIENEIRGVQQCNKTYACKLEREIYSQLESSRKKTAVSNSNYTFCDYFRPICNCPYKIPAEIFQCKNGKNRGNFFFGCVKKNMQEWLENISPFNFDDEPCNFFQWATKAIPIHTNTIPTTCLILDESDFSL